MQHSISCLVLGCGNRFTKHPLRASTMTHLEPTDGQNEACLLHLESHANANRGADFARNRQGSHIVRGAEDGLGSGPLHVIEIKKHMSGALLNAKWHRSFLL
jgi:hypothetical protein